jgi:ubiquinone/menaquinone biosynthesis C-methylase UbiE
MAARSSAYHNSMQVPPRPIDVLEQWSVRQMLWHLGYPEVILQVPCGHGRFLPLLTEMTRRTVLAMDTDRALLEATRAAQPHGVAGQVETRVGSPFEMQADDQSVDCVVTLDFVQHLVRDEDRAAFLRECHRVTRRGLCVGLPVDGNLAAFGRRQLSHRYYLAKATGPDSWVIHARRMLEAEFAHEGFRVVHHQDALPGILGWRTYALLRMHK